MQSTALAVSTSTSFLKPPCRNSFLNGSQLSPATSLIQVDNLTKVHRLSGQTALYTFSSSNASFIFSNSRYDHLKVRAASVTESADEASKQSGLVKTLQLGSMFRIWYLLNIYFYIYSKQLAAVLPLGVAHTVGNLLTNISLGKVAVSFTHTIKAMEPLFTVVFSALLLAEVSICVVSSLVRIVGGVALASFTGASFEWIGFGSAMASNVTNQSRNVLSKKFMVIKRVITINSFILLVPLAILLEGVKFTPYLHSAANQGLNIKELCIRSLLAGFCFYPYQQVSYMILQMVSPVTHAVGNCVKRVVVIVSSVVFFQTPVSPINALGTAFDLAGVFLYSRAKRLKPKPN